jgi:hypothetical protein
MGLMIDEQRPTWFCDVMMNSQHNWREMRFQTTMQQFLYRAKYGEFKKKRAEWVDTGVAREARS